jgi:CubicO group peptidase (beta-lactamase class C family)
MLVVAIAVVVAGLVSAGPAHAEPWQARHGLSPAEYQKAFDQLTAQGYRLASVSGYVSGGRELYAALWVKRPGPAWVARHGLSSGDYQKAFDDLAKQGYRLVWVSGHEAGGQVRYAAIWDKAPGPAWSARHGLTGDEYQATFDTLAKQGYRLVHVSGYTQGGSARYAAIWEKASGPAWVARHGLSAEEYQKAFDEYLKQGYRLRMVSGYHPIAGDRYVALWEKAGGPPWAARHGIRESQYQNVFDNFSDQGYQPVFVTAFGSGSAARMNGLWTNTSFSAADLHAIHQALAGALKTSKTAGLSLAVAKDGRLVYAAGFGDADKENDVDMSVNHRLRIGSISKTITATAVFRLIEAKAQFAGAPISLETPVFGAGGILGNRIKVPDLLKPLNDARLHHFLEHTSGIPNGAGDPVHCESGNLDKRIEYQLGQVQSIPASSTDLVGPVPRAPGAKFDYSNLNFIILERVIEVLSGDSYESYVRKHVFAPAEISAPRLFRIGPYDPGSGEAKHYLANGAYAEYSPQGTCEMKPPGTGAGGWAMSAKDLLHFLASVDGIAPGEILKKETRAEMVTGSPVKAGYGKGWILMGWGSCNSSWTITQGHNGGLAGAYSSLFLLPNGMSFALIGNQDTPKAGTCTPVAGPGGTKPAAVACGGAKQPPCSDEPVARVIELLNSVTWPSYNLF